MKKKLSEDLVWFGWIPDGTETFRFVSVGHPFHGGYNGQTVPKETRHLFLPPLGRVWVQPDLSQAEARYVAHRAGCKGLIELFNDPARHVHMERAVQIYGHSVERDSPEYVQAKSIVHASHYREQPLKLALQLGIETRKARLLLKAALAPYPEIYAWHEEVKHLLAKRGWLENCWGQRRYFYEAVGMLLATGKIGDEQWKDAIAWEPQSSIPQIINQAIHRLRLGPLDVWFHQHGHDSFLASIPEERAGCGVYAGEILGALHTSMLVGGLPLVIPVELSVGWNWGQLVPWGVCNRRQEWEELVGRDRIQTGFLIESLLKA